MKNATITDFLKSVNSIETKEQLVDALSALNWVYSEEALEDEDKAFDNLVVAIKTIQTRITALGWYNTRIRARKTYLLRQESCIEKAKDYYQKNKDYFRAYQKANGHKYKDRYKKYRENRKEIQRAYFHEWYKKKKGIEETRKYKKRSEYWDTKNS